MTEGTCKAHFFIGGLIALFLGCNDSNQKQPQPNPPFLGYWLPMFQEGDVIFRHGIGAVSDWINYKQSSAIHVSHTGIVVNLNKKWVIIHSISGMLDAEDGVQVSSIEQFLREAKPNTVFILRPNLSKKNRKAAAKKALLCLKKGIRFDHQFNPNDSSKLYCSELIFYCYSHAGKQWSSQNPTTDFQILTDSSLGKLIAPSIPWKETRVH